MAKENEAPRKDQRDPAAEAAISSFEEDHSPRARRRDGRSIAHSYGVEGRNFVN